MLHGGVREPRAREVMSDVVFACLSAAVQAGAWRASHPTRSAPRIGYEANRSKCQEHGKSLKAHSSRAVTNSISPSATGYCRR